VLHARTLPGNPYDGHTLGAVIEATERLTGREIERAYVDRGYRALTRRLFCGSPSALAISTPTRGADFACCANLLQRTAGPYIGVMSAGSEESDDRGRVRGRAHTVPATVEPRRAGELGETRESPSGRMVREKKTVCRD
jgi:hypothetical protein